MHRGRRAVFRNVKRSSKKEKRDDNREDSSEEEEVEIVNQDMWNSLWMKILEDLRDDEYLFGMFRESLHRTIDKMNPLINFYSSGMGIGLLEKVLMECQLLSVNSYPYITDQQVEDIKKLLAKKDNDPETPVEEPKEEEEDPEQQVIKRLKWGAPIREIRIGNFEAQRSWLKQFALKINTSTSSPSLDITMFKFMPEELPAEINKTISKGPTRELMQHFMRQFNRFEVSRVLRIRAPLDSIDGINFFRSEKNEDFGLLTFLLKTPPTFSSRRISSQTESHNEWKERIDFTTNSQASKFNRIYLCGDYIELETIVAALVALNPNFKQYLTTGIQDIGDDTTKYDDENKNNIIPPLASDLPKVFPIPYSFQINNIQPEEDSLLHSDIDSDTDEPVWLGWNGPNDDNDEEEDNIGNNWNDDEEEDYEDALPEDIDEEEAEEFIEQLHHLGIDPSHLFSQMGVDDDDYDEEGPYDEEEDEDYEEDEDEEGPYHRGPRGGGPPQCAQQ